MAYNINGKIYTSHPLMDEIVYNCKLILDNIVIKNDVLANDNEDLSFIDDVECYMMIKDGSISFSSFPFTENILTAFGYSNKLAKSILINKENVPNGDRDSLVSFACKYFMDNYEEKNNYYRMLMGLPEYGTNEYNVYIDKSYLPSNYLKDVDFSKPLHEFDSSIISILQITGKISQLQKNYKGSNYSYLKFLGDSSIELYKARKAKKYDILYMPSVESLVNDRFQELYNLNRDIFLKRTYSEAYSYNSDYYEQCIIIMILAQTFNDMIVDVPEWYIRRDIFDIRSVQYFLDSYGVEFFKEIPLKYQIRIVKNLNKLIKYKSSNKNFADILEIFSLKDTSIFKYYLYKKRLKDSAGNYMSGVFDEEKYDLEFVQAKINDSYDNYIKDMIYRTPYDDITYQDKYWDGEDTHSYIKNKHIERDFTIEGTKYMSIEYKISLSEYLFQMQFFMGLIMDSNIDSSDIKIAIPSIESNVSFKLSDLYLFLCLITLGYDKCNLDITRPEDINSHHTLEKPEFQKYHDLNGGYSYTNESEYDHIYSANGGSGEGGYLHADGGDKVEYSEMRSIEDLYDWMKDKMPEFFTTSNDRVYGFNTDVNLTAISLILKRRHSQFQFDKGFTLSNLGVDKYIVPTKITTLDELTNIYFNNKECYDNLKKKMVESVDDRDEFTTMKFVFDKLFTKKFDYNYYKINNGDSDAKTLDQILQDHDYILYNRYIKIMSETNMETRKDNIRNIMNDIVNTLEYYLSGEGLEYIFSFATVNSFNSLVNYIYLMINFFKSYKVYFLDPFVTYRADDKLENNATGYDSIAEKKINYWKWDKEFKRDNIRLKSLRFFKEDYKASIIEALDIYGHFEPDPDDDYDYDGMYADTENTLTVFKDADGGYADGKLCIPYIVLNGGASHDGRIDLWDLNGASAYEMQEVVDVDGGYPLNTEDYRKDYWETAFSYIIDGGSASTNQFLSRSIHVKVVDKQIESEIRVSNLEGNGLVVQDDGLYLKQQWTSWLEFDELHDDARDTFDYFTESFNTISDVIEISSNPELLDERINDSIFYHLAGMRKFVSYMEGDSFEHSLNKYVDAGVKKLYEEFYSYSPFAWDNF